MGYLFVYTCAKIVVDGGSHCSSKLIDIKFN